MLSVLTMCARNVHPNSFFFSSLEVLEMLSVRPMRNLSHVYSFQSLSHRNVHPKVAFPLVSKQNMNMSLRISSRFYSSSSVYAYRKRLENSLEHQPISGYWIRSFSTMSGPSPEAILTDEDIITAFWNQFEKDMASLACIVEKDKYPNQVYRKLFDFKAEHLDDKETESELIDLQAEIEDLMRGFDEKTIFQETPNFIQKLIGEESISAKQYLMSRVSEDILNSIIAPFGEYTLEAILIYALGYTFHNPKKQASVRLSTFLALLKQIIEIQAFYESRRERGRGESQAGDSQAGSCQDLSIFPKELNPSLLLNLETNKSRLNYIPIPTKRFIDCMTERNVRTRKSFILPKQERKKSSSYLQICRSLIDFMTERNVITSETIIADKAVVQKKGKASKEKNTFLYSNFDFSLLPLKVNLPMVCKPVDWHHPSEYDISCPIEKTTYMLADMKGGYLSRPSLSMYRGLLSSNNPEYFNIEMDGSTYREMCSILNWLQNYGFRINTKVLKFIHKNRSTLEEVGLLMPQILSEFNLKEAFNLLRESFYLNKEIGRTCTLDSLIEELSVRVEQARYENFVINLAVAYQEYIFYLPAFMDFHGHIYRSGFLHFHERDLAKGLIVLAEEEAMEEEVLDIVFNSAAFKDQKFQSDEEARKWFQENQSLIYESDASLIRFAKYASKPFQFIAKVLCQKGVPDSIFISQDDEDQSSTSDDQDESSTSQI